VIIRRWFRERGAAAELVVHSAHVSCSTIAATIATASAATAASPIDFSEIINNDINHEQVVRDLARAGQKSID
jgi:hypothetical protein